jgi:hypothetical protein
MQSAQPMKRYVAGGNPFAFGFQKAFNKNYELLRICFWNQSTAQSGVDISAYWFLERQHTILSDASYAGIGGWLPDFKIQWRVTRADLVLLGFKMKHINKYKQEPLDAKTDGLHINPLEFLAAIINLWLVLKLVQQLPPLLTGYIIDLLSNNTMALS